MEPWVDVRCGEVREVLAQLPEKSVQVVVTSPPYWNLRNYGAQVGMLGSEATPDLYVAAMVEVMEGVRRVLRDDGTVWLNLGDCYAHDIPYQVPDSKHKDVGNGAPRHIPSGLKKGDLIGIPWRVAFALQAAGWYLRSDVIWFKPNPMPESVRTRPTRAHEYLFLLSKSQTYYYDIEATKEPYADSTQKEAAAAYRGQETKDYAAAGAQAPSATKRRILEAVKRGGGRQKRDVWKVEEGAVWTIPVQPYRGGHFATFPEQLVAPPILAGSSGGGQCAGCGTPTTRIVEREPIPQEIKDAFEAARVRTAEATGRTDGHTNFKPNFRRASSTLGWAPGCDCAEKVGRVHWHLLNEPQIVLDPFVGSGRAGMVARKLGRSFIGIDLNEGYVAQALTNILEVDIEAPSHAQ
jgi:DNA modification methylase